MDRAEPSLHVEVAFSPAARQVRSVQLVLPAGSTVGDALQASGWATEFSLSLETMNCGVWGKLKPPDTPLRDGDRVEIYRPLTVDPKEARRLRYKKQRKG